MSTYAWDIVTALLTSILCVIVFYIIGIPEVTGTTPCFGVFSWMLIV